MLSCYAPPGLVSCYTVSPAASQAARRLKVDGDPRSSALSLALPLLFHRAALLLDPGEARARVGHGHPGGGRVDAVAEVREVVVVAFGTPSLQVPQLPAADHVDAIGRASVDGLAGRVGLLALLHHARRATCILVHVEGAAGDGRAVGAADTWRVKRSDTGEFGGAWLEGHGLSVGSEVLGLSSRVLRAA